MAPESMSLSSCASSRYSHSPLKMNLPTFLLHKESDNFVYSSLLTSSIPIMQSCLTLESILAQIVIVHFRCLFLLLSCSALATSLISMLPLFDLSLSLITTSCLFQFSYASDGASRTASSPLVGRHGEELFSFPPSLDASNAPSHHTTHTTLTGNALPIRVHRKLCAPNV
ncbi:hypothetical protein GQ43DRAFT_134553 [Delitschia confertaspora ATCC 74209]|uniref:Uncharacterized protein n=1 Tax=Delitschia confertaspora ATCC 74209 TaxID=1513339 RepID=A0A9P4MQ61_9PLEO|nr:hypothetical protein GQ43DRAFT_134553 [Delitschia confertaspora ATCC 74209]